MRFSTAPLRYRSLLFLSGIADSTSPSIFPSFSLFQLSLKCVNIQNKTYRYTCTSKHFLNTSANQRSRKQKLNWEQNLWCTRLYQCCLILSTMGQCGCRFSFHQTGVTADSQLVLAFRQISVVAPACFCDRNDILDIRTSTQDRTIVKAGITEYSSLLINQTRIQQLFGMYKWNVNLIRLEKKEQ